MKPRKPSPLQTELLKLLYKFRFTTAPLLATHKRKDQVTITQSLKTLLDKKYIARNYTPAYKLAGRGAEYYLTNDGIRYLRQNYKLSEEVLHAMYKNKSIGQPFIQKCLLIYQVYISLQNQYGQTMKLYTRSEMQNAEGFPAPLPDLYLTYNDKDYLLDIFTEYLFFYVKKRIDLIMKHYESDEWPDDTYPTILLVFPDSRIEAKAQAYIEKVKDDAYIEDTDLNILTTTTGALLKGSDNNIWSSGKEKMPVSLK
jgi:hypothetical protein